MRPTDGRHTHGGLISPSDWSSRSGSTRCPSQQSSELEIGQADEEWLVVWQKSWVGTKAEEEDGGLGSSRDRNPQRLTATPESCFKCHMNLRDKQREMRGRHQNLPSAFNKYSNDCHAILFWAKLLVTVQHFIKTLLQNLIASLICYVYIVDKCVPFTLHAQLRIIYETNFMWKT